MSRELYLLILFGLFILFAIVYIICWTIRRINMEKNSTALLILDTISNIKDIEEDEEEE